MIFVYDRSFYDRYMETEHWYKLKKKYIYDNPNACCWICGIKKFLLLHHVDYANLYYEKLYRDIYIICFDCHQKIHFSFFGLFKTPLIKKKLLIRMRFLKFIFCIQHKQIGLSIYYGLRCII